MPQQNSIEIKASGTILSFGEILLRICPDLNGGWLKENKLPFYIGGAELNVATALALWDLPSAYISAMPDNSITREIEQELISKNVDVSSMIFQGDRLGLYYLPKGSDLKNAGVVYDRANSSYAELDVGQVDWDQVFEGVTWFHFSAICPAISSSVAALCLEAVKKAKSKNITVSFDLNYRSKLWKYGKDPIEIVPELAKYCDLIMGNIWAAHNMLGIQQNELLLRNEEFKKSILLEQASLTSQKIIESYPNCKAVANTFRFDKGKGINYYTTLFTNNHLTVSPEYTSDFILDKVGSGDCFMAGLIYGFYQELPQEEILSFATAAAYDKLFIASDATTSNVTDIKKRIIANE